jgi:hypothetical protein
MFDYGLEAQGWSTRDDWACDATLAIWAPAADCPRRSADRAPVSAAPGVRLSVASASEQASRVMELLGLSEDELCETLGVDPLSLLSGQLEHRPELPVLLDLLRDAEEHAGPTVLRRWVRATGPAGRPIDALLRRDFASFEDALGALEARGFVLRGGGRDDTPGPAG